MAARADAKLSWLVTGLLLACGAKDDAGGSSTYSDYMDDDIPAGEQCTTTGTVFDTETESCEGTADAGGTAGSEEDQCRTAGDCADGEFCAALFDGDRQPFVCLPACLELMDDDFWCADATACCDAGASCTMRGYCVATDDGTSTTGP